MCFFTWLIIMFKFSLSWTVSICEHPIKELFFFFFSSIHTYLILLTSPHIPYFRRSKWRSIVGFQKSQYALLFTFLSVYFRKSVEVLALSEGWERHCFWSQPPSGLYCLYVSVCISVRISVYVCLCLSVHFYHLLCLFYSISLPFLLCPSPSSQPFPCLSSVWWDVCLHVWLWRLYVGVRSSQRRRNTSKSEDGVGLVAGSEHAGL